MEKFQPPPVAVEKTARPAIKVYPPVHISHQENTGAPKHYPSDDEAPTPSVKIFEGQGLS